MDLETFTLLPLHLDPTSKALSCPTHASAHINSELTELNTLHRLLINITDSPIGTNIPPPPIPLNPKRGAQIAKMREQANTLMRRGRRDDAEEAVKCASPPPPQPPSPLQSLHPTSLSTPPLTPSPPTPGGTISDSTPTR